MAGLLAAVSALNGLLGLFFLLPLSKQPPRSRALAIGEAALSAGYLLTSLVCAAAARALW